jgi:hypothetical protein
VAELSQYLAAPRLEVVMAPEGDEFLLWLLLHVPGDDDAQVRQLTGPLPQDRAVEKLIDAFRAIAQQFPESGLASEAEPKKIPEMSS